MPGRCIGAANGFNFIAQSENMRWIYKDTPPEAAISKLASALKVDRLLAALLLQRDITSFEEARLFFRPELSHLHDPFLMKDMDRAVARIQKAIEEEERILVYGDYDVDGTTAVALMVAYLRSFYSHVASYIPDRYKEGYGVSVEGIDFAADNGIGLIIALDCGIKANKQVAYAAEKGIDFIICDHHRPGAALPAAEAILDPKREDCTYPFPELCGCGVGFKLIQALHVSKGNSVESLLPYLDLVATAIAADIVPITGENRILATYGLRVINDSPRPGIRALMQQQEKKDFKISDLVFQLAPRINAAGRMHHGEQAVELLIETNFQRAIALAGVIDSMNAERRDMDRQITLEALEMIRRNGEEESWSTVVYKEDWHKGVIGIVASRLIETFYRPTLVFTRSGDKLAASARSVRGFDLYEALEACSDCIEQFGGHTYAAGLTIESSRFEEFKVRFEEQVARTMDPALLQPEISVDLPVELKDINERLLRILSQFAPFGPGNATPIFGAAPLRDTGYAKKVGQDGAHLKLAVKQGDSAVFQAIGFGLGDRLEIIKGGKPFEAVFSIEENHWQGKRNIQLRIRDIKAL